MGKRKKHNEMTYAHNGVYSEKGINSQEAYQAAWKAQLDELVADMPKEEANGESDRTRTPECLE